jgi:hypothetical protein
MSYDATCGVLIYEIIFEPSEHYLQMSIPRKSDKASFRKTQGSDVPAQYGIRAEATHSVRPVVFLLFANETVQSPCKVLAF